MHNITPYWRNKKLLGLSPVGMRGHGQHVSRRVTETRVKGFATLQHTRNTQNFVRTRIYLTRWKFNGTPGPISCRFERTFHNLKAWTLLLLLLLYYSYTGHNADKPFSSVRALDSAPVGSGPPAGLAYFPPRVREHMGSVTLCLELGLGLGLGLRFRLGLGLEFGLRFGWGTFQVECC